MNLILNDICTPKSSSLKLSNVLENGNYPVYGASGICGYLNDFQIEKEAIAIVKDGAGIGRVHLMLPKSSVLGTMQIIVPNKNVNAEYLYYLLQYMDLGSTFDGATIPHIYFKNYSKKVIKKHSYEEQKKISKELSKIDKLILNKNNVLITLDQLIKSRFIELFENKGFPLIEIKKVVDTKKISAKKKYLCDESIEYIDISSIDNVKNIIIGSTSYIFEKAPSRAQQCLLREDILISTVRPNLKNIALFNIDNEGYVGSSGFCVLRSTKCNPYYLLHCVLSDDFTNSMCKVTSGASYPAIRDEDVFNYKIINAPIELQNQFAEFVKLIDKSKFIVQKQIKELQELLDSKMDEYFR